MEEKVTVEITNDKLEQSIKEYAKEQHQGKAHRDFKSPAPDEASRSCHVKGTGPAGSMFS